jgi:hypothetical protein
MQAVAVAVLEALSLLLVQADQAEAERVHLIILLQLLGQQIQVGVAVVAVIQVDQAGQVVRVDQEL